MIKSKTSVVFGYGAVIVSTAFHEGVAYVLIKNAKEPGELGSKVDDVVEGELCNIDEWEMFLQFPTMEKANKVYNAMLGIEE